MSLTISNQSDDTTSLEKSNQSESSSSLYFFISYPRAKKEKEDSIYFIFPEDKNHVPKCIHKEETFENKVYYYQKIFMVNKATTGKKPNNYYFEFEIDDDKYINDMLTEA